MKIMLKNKNMTGVFSISGRSIVCTGATVYDLPEPDARTLLDTGKFEEWKKPVDKPVMFPSTYLIPSPTPSSTIRMDRARISLEPHEQKYLKNKIEDMTKDSLLKLYERTEGELGSEDIMDLEKTKKDEIIKIITENFAKINERKVVNKMIKEIKREDQGNI